YDEELQAKESAVWNPRGPHFFWINLLFPKVLNPPFWAQDPCCTYIKTKPQPLLGRGISTNFGTFQTVPSACRAFSKGSAVSFLSRIVRRLDRVQVINDPVLGWVWVSGSNASEFECCCELKFSHFL